jgi:hypothetical protein
VKKWEERPTLQQLSLIASLIIGLLLLYAVFHNWSKGALLGLGCLVFFVVLFVGAMGEEIRKIKRQLLDKQPLEESTASEAAETGKRFKFTLSERLSIGLGAAFYLLVMLYVVRHVDSLAHLIGYACWFFALTVVILGAVLLGMRNRRARDKSGRT